MEIDYSENNFNKIITNVVYGVRTFQGKILCEKCFNSCRIREKMPDIPFDYLVKKVNTCSMNKSNRIKQCKGHFSKTDQTCFHGEMYDDIITCNKCSDYYMNNIIINSN